jgi:hypothetical protein
VPNSSRPDVVEVQKKLLILVSVIVVSVVGLIALTLYLYARFTRGITLAQ